jgi:hypothetical protein
MIEKNSAVIGQWRIFESDLYEPHDLDVVEPAFIEFRADGAGQFKYICVDGDMDVGFSPNGADFDWRASTRWMRSQAPARSTSARTASSPSQSRASWATKPPSKPAVGEFFEINRITSDADRRAVACAKDVAHRT